MSFGFSVSDFITVGKLITEITSGLKHASEEYQELCRELAVLQQALLQIDKLTGSTGSGASARQLDGIKYAALSCRLPLEQFLREIQKYENALGVKSRESDRTVKRIVRRVGWAFNKKDEVRKLQNYLNIHIGTINIMLLQHGLEGLDVASNRCDASQQDIQKNLEKTTSLVVELSANLEEQELVVKKNNSMLSSLLSFVTSDIAVSLQTLTSTVAQIW